VNGTLEIAIPPSGNHRNNSRVIVKPPKGAGNVKCPRCSKGISAFIQMANTKEYKAWREQNAALFSAAYGPHHFRVPVVLCIWIFGGRGFMENSDWDNLTKCIGDAIVDSGVIAPAEGLKPLESGNERRGEDDVRHIRGHFTRFLTRQEHWEKIGSPAQIKPDDLHARVFVKMVPASEVDPFRV
jgi:hypothetical protein